MASASKQANLRPYIHGLCEPGGTWPYGAWAEGHQDAAIFALAVRGECKRAVEPGDVQHGYYRVLRGVMHLTNARGRGASPATWVEW